MRQQAIAAKTAIYEILHAQDACRCNSEPKFWKAPLEINLAGFFL